MGSVYGRIKKLQKDQRKNNRKVIEYTKRNKKALEEYEAKRKGTPDIITLQNQLIDVKTVKEEDDLFD